MLPACQPDLWRGVNVGLDIRELGHGRVTEHEQPLDHQPFSRFNHRKLGLHQALVVRVGLERHLLPSGELQDVGMQGWVVDGLGDVKVGLAVGVDGQHLFGTVIVVQRQHGQPVPKMVLQPVQHGALS